MKPAAAGGRVEIAGEFYQIDVTSEVHGRTADDTAGSSRLAVIVGQASTAAALSC